MEQHVRRNRTPDQMFADPIKAARGGSIPSRGIAHRGHQYGVPQALQRTPTPELTLRKEIGLTRQQSERTFRRNTSIQGGGRGEITPFLHRESDRKRLIASTSRPFPEADRPHNPLNQNATESQRRNRGPVGFGEGTRPPTAHRGIPCPQRSPSR